MQQIRWSAILVVAAMGFTCPARAQDRFGAIAFSPSTGAFGFSNDHPSQSDAEAGALAECRKRAGGCQSSSWFRNACGALAVGEYGGWGTDWGNERAAAEANALNMCRRYTNNCSVLRAVCTSSPQ